MSQTRTSWNGGKGAPLEDPLQIGRHLEDLRLGETEFPIKVEGTHTLPYTAQIQALAATSLDLKLIRPLPHELAPGAPFEMLFTTAEQRFTAFLTFQGREGYLLYRFSLPVQLFPSDQRQHKRYPFRPREKAYVFAQDGGVPGHGLAGPLVNLSLGGLAFRVDRIIGLDNHLRLTPSLEFFDKGKPLPILKIRDLPRLPLFECRGMVANASDRGGEIVVGIQFGELRSSELAELQGVLDLRERMQRAGSSSVSQRGNGERPEPARGELPAAASLRHNPAGSENPEALRLLGRRSTCLMLAMAPGQSREKIRQRLLAGGYLRLEEVDTLPQALATLQAERGGSGCALIVDSEACTEEGLAQIRALHRDLGNLRELPVALLTEHPDQDVGDVQVHALNLPDGTEDDPWLRALDEVVGLPVW